MLSIEYVHKRVKVFKIELSLMLIASLALALIVWQLLRGLKLL